MEKRLKMIALAVALFLVSTSLFAVKDVTGFWKSIDDETGLPKSVVALYLYNGKLHGRIVLVYKEDGSVKDHMYTQNVRSPYLKGNPSFAGLDIIWDLEYNSRKDQWLDGKILDPGDDKEKKPKEYGCAIWQEGNDLTVRGKIAFIGRNQTWKRFNPADFPAGFQVPDYTRFRPSLPEIN